MHLRKYVLAALVACLLPAALALGAVTLQASASASPAPAAANGTAYQANLPCCTTITLGSISSPTTVLTSTVIPEGKYTVVGDVGVVMGPAASAGGQEGSVCVVGTTKAGDTIVGSGGTTGNGATESGSGASGTYGNAVEDVTVVISHTSDKLRITCNSTSGTQGTYVDAATLVATKVPAIVAI
jgi:hypothetical protein